MNNNRILIIISGLILISAARVYGEVAGYPFRDKVQKSALIVEGLIEKQTGIPDFDRKDLSAFRMKSVVKITRIYKADSAQPDIITVFSHMNFICDTSRKLAVGRRYLLMLKPHGSGFADINNGLGIWEIVTLEPDGQFVVSDSSTRTGGRSYSRFRRNLSWALAEKPSWPQKPAVSHDRAKEVALQALSNANADLKSFELVKHELLNIASDNIGIAYKGDPMWLFHWTKPDAIGQNPLPPGTFFYCYVHAHTGKTLFGPNLTTTPPARNIRLFLKTCPAYRLMYNKPADNVSIAQLTNEQFRAFLPRLRETFLKPKSSYPDSTTFLKAEFPSARQAGPVIFVMNQAGRIDFAGIIPTEI
ncbi:MAG: hypothetical protein ACYS32_15535 [Planctomycetota bacterium]|jgi:hypothetical protein